MESMMDAIDDNVLTEILLHLPMKIKFRCRAVCKRWLHLISTPFFKERVLAKEQDTPWYLLYHFCVPYPIDEDLRLLVASQHNTDESFIRTIILNFPSWHDHQPLVFAAHNGLILCSRKSLVGPKAELYVCNPLIGEWVSLPDPQIDRWRLMGFIVSFNNGSTKFMVVRVIFKGKNRRSNFEVFSSDVGEWRDTGVTFPDVEYFGHYSIFGGVVHDGKLIWNVGSKTRSLVAYDPDKNECRSFKVPLSDRSGLIGTSCGRLCYASLASDHRKDPLSVCVLENYETEEWKPLLMTQMSTVLDVNEINQNDRCYYMMPLAFHPFDMDTVFFDLKKSLGSSIFSFNLRTKKLIRLNEEQIPKGFYVKCAVYLCIVPPWPTSVPPPIWETTSSPQPISETASAPGDDDRHQ